MIDIHKAIYALNSSIVTINGDVAYGQDGNEIAYDKSAVEAKLTELQIQAQKDVCKAKAKALLAATDYTILTDVPLDNKAEYKTYRATLRDLVLNPVADPVFPDEPVPVWK